VGEHGGAIDGDGAIRPFQGDGTAFSPPRRPDGGAKARFHSAAGRELPDLQASQFRMNDDVVGIRRNSREKGRRPLTVLPGACRSQLTAASEATRGRRAESESRTQEHAAAAPPPANQGSESPHGSGGFSTHRRHSTPELQFEEVDARLEKIKFRRLRIASLTTIVPLTRSHRPGAGHSGPAARLPRRPPRRKPPKRQKTTKSPVAKRPTTDRARGPEVDFNTHTIAPSPRPARPGFFMGNPQPRGERSAPWRAGGQQAQAPGLQRAARKACQIGRGRERLATIFPISDFSFYFGINYLETELGKTAQSPGAGIEDPGGEEPLLQWRAPSKQRGRLTS